MAHHPLRADDLRRRLGIPGNRPMLPGDVANWGTITRPELLRLWESRWPRRALYPNTDLLSYRGPCFISSPFPRVPWSFFAELAYQDRFRRYYPGDRDDPARTVGRVGMVDRVGSFLAVLEAGEAEIEALFTLDELTRSPQQLRERRY